MMSGGNSQCQARIVNQCDVWGRLSSVELLGYEMLCGQWLERCGWWVPHPAKNLEFNLRAQWGSKGFKLKETCLDLHWRTVPLGGV